MDENAADIWRRIVPPLVTAFVLFLVLLRYALRHPVPQPAPASPSWRTFFGYLLVTVGGGYAAMLVIVLVFHVILARDAGAFRSATAGGAVLAFGVAVPVFTVSEWVQRRRAQPTGQR